MRHLLTRTARRGDTRGVALVRDVWRLLGGPLALGLMLKFFWHPHDFGTLRRQLLNLKRVVETA
jgi:hypothetical protein